jgi:hypothetical protein
MTAACFHERFEALVPRIREAAGFAFQALNTGDREEAVADVCAAAWSAWHGLIRRGKDPLEVGPCGILSNAIRYVRGGRRVGHAGSGRGRMDPWSNKARRRGGFALLSLDHPGRGFQFEAWVAGDRRWTPADQAAFLIDFRDWLGRLPERRRLSARLLAQGCGTGEVAGRLGVTPSAISQARAELARSWAEFQGDRTA